VLVGFKIWYVSDIHTDKATITQFDILAETIIESMEEAATLL